MSVYHSLIRWLEELKKEWNDIIYNVNPVTKEIHDTVIVLIGKDTLQYALDLKKQGKIKKILAWPAIDVVISSTHIIYDSWIDGILMPSLWCKEYMLDLKKDYDEDKIIVRPAGVKDTWISEKKSSQLLIYKKKCPEELYNIICNILDSLQISYSVIVYGLFNFNEYQNLLNDSMAMIYLQESESQWIALQEARVKDIPTLVWDRWYRTYNWEKRRSASNISCPWLTSTCGMTFTENANIREKILNFIQLVDSFSPRSFCISNYSDIVSTKIILQYI